MIAAATAVLSFFVAKKHLCSIMDSSLYHLYQCLFLFSAVIWFVIIAGNAESGYCCFSDE